MPEPRSPNYPVISLPAAIERAAALYKQDGKAAVPLEAAVRAWGYSSVNGRALRTAGALRAYGLLEYPANKTVKLTTRALAILLEPADSPVRQDALREAVLTPPMFSFLREQYSDGLPSDQAIISALVRGSFHEDAAAKLVSVYRASIDFVNPDDKSPQLVQGSAPSTSTQSGNGSEAAPIRLNQELSMPDISGQSVRPYDLSLALMDGLQATLRIPRHMSERNFMMLKALLIANLDGMKPAIVADEPNSDP